MTTVYGAGTTFTLHIVMSVCGFDFVATDITTNGISNDHRHFLLWGDSLEGINGIFSFNNQINIASHINDIGEGNSMRAKGIIANINQKPAALPRLKIHDLASSA